jgi:PAS domain S-box-containing protein
LETERARLVEAQAVAKVGSWEIELPSLDITWSEQTHRIFETDPSNFHPRRPGFMELVHPEDRAKVNAVFEASLENGAPSTVEYRIVMTDGRVKVLEEHWKVFQDGQGRPARLVGTCQDITERKGTEEALRVSEAREREKAKELETILDTLPVQVVIAHDPQLRHVTANRAGRALLHLEPGASLTLRPAPGEKLQMRYWRDGIEIPTGELPMERAIATGQLVQGVATDVVLADGTTTYQMGNAAPLLDDWGNVRGAVGASIDLTELRLAEQALRESELHFRTVFERSPLGIALVDSRSGRFMQCNPKFCEIVGREEKEVLQLDIPSITHPDDIGQGSEYQRQLVEEKLASYEMNKRYVRPDGSARWVRILAVPMWSKGETRRWQMALVQDITERRHSEAAIASLVRELSEAKKKLTEEKLYLEQEIDTELGFGEIIGQSNALRDVMDQVGKVASVNATVLLLGETGTGKELVARAIHRLSRRSQSSFIKMNCAAIPHGLLESELFGHERGAFTGAVVRKIGRLELADKGTLFLDEIGEISLALQPKLLRVLQDQEFERLGGTQTLKVDFRLIAATNSNLADRVRENDFRSDLYYRLNVFPIRVPPLRERREDIRLLV